MQCNQTMINDKLMINDKYYTMYTIHTVGKKKIKKKKHTQQQQMFYKHKSWMLKKKKKNYDILINSFNLMSCGITK